MNLYSGIILAVRGLKHYNAKYTGFQGFIGKRERYQAGIFSANCRLTPSPVRYPACETSNWMKKLCLDVAICNLYELAKF